MKWKQVFCRHIWKETKVEELGNIRLEIAHFLWHTYRREAITSMCVKCNKIRVTERKVLIV